MPIALRRPGNPSARDEGVERPRPHPQPSHERVGGAAVAQDPGVAALAHGNRRGGQLAAEAQPAAPERDLEVRPCADLQTGLLAVGDRDRDRAVRALLADQRLVAADVEDQDPGAHGVVAAIAADRAWRAVLLALAPAHDAQRAQ